MACILIFVKIWTPVFTFYFWLINLWWTYVLRINVLIVFKVSLKFDPVKEILNIQCQIYILLKKVIILRNIHVTIKSFAPPFFNHFILSLNKKKFVHWWTQMCFDTVRAVWAPKKICPNNISSTFLRSSFSTF